MATDSIDLAACRERARQLLDLDNLPPAPTGNAQVLVEILVCVGERTHGWEWPGRPEFREQLVDEVFPVLLLFAQQRDRGEKLTVNGKPGASLRRPFSESLRDFFFTVSRRRAELKHWLETRDHIFGAEKGKANKRRRR